MTPPVGATIVHDGETWTRHHAKGGDAYWQNDRGGALTYGDSTLLDRLWVAERARDHAADVMRMIDLHQQEDRDAVKFWLDAYPATPPAPASP